MWIDITSMPVDAPRELEEAWSRAKQQPERYEFFLIPSADAPLRLTDTRYFRSGAEDEANDNEVLREKKDLVWKFVNRFNGKDLRGACFIDKQNEATGGRAKVYCRDFDYWLLTGGREFGLDCWTWRVSLIIGSITLSAGVAAAIGSLVH